MALQFAKKWSLIFFLGRTLLILVGVTGVTGANMKLIIYHENDQNCIHDIKVYKNAVFNDNFTEIFIPKFPGMTDSYCTNYCIRTQLCNAVIVAQSTQYEYQNREHVYLTEFDWCAAYKIQKKDISVTDLASSKQSAVVDTWGGGIIPNKSQLIIINIDACCPNRCPKECECQNTEDGQFLCTSPLSTFKWFGPEAKVYLRFEEDICWTDIVGNVQFADGMANNALLLDGETTLEINMLNHGGCWKNVSSCKSIGFSVAFWIQILSNSGSENHHEVVGVISAINRWNTQGWAVHILNWQSTNYLKIQINDMQMGNQAFKHLDEGPLLFNKWLHYVVSYKYKVQNDDPNVLFKIYKNGQPDNNGYAHYENHVNSKDSVDKLAFGKLVFDTNTGPFATVMLDNLVIVEGTFNEALASQLYQEVFPD